MSEFGASIAALNKTLLFLLKVTVAGISIAALIVVFIPGQEAPKTLGEYLAFLVFPIVGICFVATVFILPIGLWQIIRFWVFRRSYYREELSLLEYIFFPASIVVFPKRLTPTGREMRKELMAALSWLGVGVILASIVLFLSDLRLVENIT